MQTLHIHPDNPQPQLINKVVQTLKNDELIILPTQYGYVFVQAKHYLQHPMSLPQDARRLIWLFLHFCFY